MMLIDLQSVWGRIGSIYQSNATVYHDNSSSSKSRTGCIRKPGDWVFWDMLHFAAIVFVLIGVPLRIGFNINVRPDQPFFYVEAGIDVFFILDLLLNFRTAYVLEDGLVEDSPKYIAAHYLKTWFSLILLVRFLCNI